jgi:Flp pilus assembly secretin CpaC
LIPYPTVTAIQGSTSTSVSKERVSLSITIKPQINKLSNFVKLDVTSKLGDLSNRVLPAAVQNLAFATTERNAKTSVVVADADTVVLGGLIRDKQSDTVSKIPILGDIPILGWLFRAKTSTVDKTNLLIFITPHIIRQYETIRATLDRKLKERDDFLETNAGGKDPMRKYRDEMIRNLPDIKELMAKKPQATVTIDEEQEVPTESHIGTPPPPKENPPGAVLVPPLVVPTPSAPPQSVAPQQPPVAPPNENVPVPPAPGTMEAPTAPVPPPPAPNGGAPSS